MTRVLETITEYAEQPPCKTAEEMEEICCEPTAALQCCTKVDPQWEGHTLAEALAHLGIVLDASGRDQNGDYVSVEFAPRLKPCGEQVTEYDTSPTNCCDVVVPLAVDNDSTPDVLPAGESIMIYFDDGVAPYTIKTSNSNTRLGNGRRSQVSESPVALVAANEDFCGATEISCSDGCTSVSKKVRSDQGHWVVDQPDGCALPGRVGEPFAINVPGLVGNGYAAVEEDVMQFEQQVAVSGRRASEPHYFGGIYENDDYDFPPPVCPEFGQGVCANMGGEAAVQAQHCTCAGAAGLPDPVNPPCLASTMDYSHLSYAAQCAANMWVIHSGYYVLGPGACAEGIWVNAVRGYEARWMESYSKTTLKWVC